MKKVYLAVVITMMLTGVGAASAQTPAPLPPTGTDRGISIGGTGGIGAVQKIGPAETSKLRQRVVAELKTTFASKYTRTISLHDVLNPDIIAAYNRKSTGEKFLIDPSL